MQPEEKNKTSQGGCLKTLGTGFGLMVVILVAVLGGFILLRAAGSYLVYSDELEPASAIVVLRRH